MNNAMSLIISFSSIFLSVKHIFRSLPQDFPRMLLIIEIFALYRIIIMPIVIFFGTDAIITCLTAIFFFPFKLLSVPYFNKINKILFKIKDPNNDFTLSRILSGLVSIFIIMVFTFGNLHVNSFIVLFVLYILEECVFISLSGLNQVSSS